MSFSRREGLDERYNVAQLDGIDNGLRNGIWNCIFEIIVNGRRLPPSYDKPYDSATRILLIDCWAVVFKKPIDDVVDLRKDLLALRIKERILNAEWYSIYDFLEYFIQNDINSQRRSVFKNYCNFILERENSGYRIIGDKVCPIISPIEVEEIEKATVCSRSEISNHFTHAITLLSDKQNPDYRNSIKESISAVESVCKLISHDSHASLGKAFREIEKEGRYELHPYFKEAIQKLYGWTSDADGIRHALTDTSTVPLAHARYMLVTCSAFVNYLLDEAEKQGIELGYT